VLIVLADQLGKSVGDMYLGAWGPSIFQIALFGRLHFRSRRVQTGPCAAGAQGTPEPADRLGRCWRKCLLGIIPSAGN